MADLSVLVPHLSPNPASEDVRLELAIPIGAPFELELLRGDGALVWRVQCHYRDDFACDIATLQDGLYLLRIITAEGQAIERLMVQN
jgi:hypothetical protein